MSDMTEGWDPEVGPWACAICGPETPAEPTTEKRASGYGWMVECPEGHVTIGVPGIEWLEAAKPKTAMTLHMSFEVEAPATADELEIVEVYEQYLRAHLFAGSIGLRRGCGTVTTKALHFEGAVVTSDDNFGQEPEGSK